MGAGNNAGTGGASRPPSGNPSTADCNSTTQMQKRPYKGDRSSPSWTRRRTEDISEYEVLIMDLGSTLISQSILHRFLIDINIPLQRRDYRRLEQPSCHSSAISIRAAALNTCMRYINIDSLFWGIRQGCGDDHRHKYTRGCAYLSLIL
ncbi:hypothetical protein BYT27DRAFT_7203001 [Phlegmacium glaucopus]|nr:hypothetical protein BYT27DRAFT_7203001 [Phlegmacium glaucopus]